MIEAGRGVRIAVIDSGVNLRHPHITARTQRVVFTPDGTGEDLLGHGTAVMAAIQEKAPSAEYWALKIFSRTLRARYTRLSAALEWAIANRMDIVNLSLGTPNQEARESLQSLVDQAAASGTIIVAASANKYRAMLPGTLDGVISVEQDDDIPRMEYRLSGNGLRFRAAGYPRPLPGMPIDANLSGVSFAVANMSGFIARICEDIHPRTPEAVYEALGSVLQVSC